MGSCHWPLAEMRPPCSGLLLPLLSLLSLAGIQAKVTATQAKCSLSEAQLDQILEPGNWPFPIPLPVDIKDVRTGLKYFYGDHVDWDALLAYKISDSSFVRDMGMTSRLVDELKGMYASRSQPPVEKYKHWTIFRSPKNVNDLMLTEVSLASDQMLHYMDKINIILNGAIISTEMNTHWLYDDKKKQLDLLKGISKGIYMIKDLGNSPYMKTIMDKKSQKMALDYVKKNSAHHVACLYDLLEMRNLTLYKTFMSAVPQDKLDKFINEFTVEAVNLINADGTKLNAEKVLESVNAAVKRTDFDEITSKLFLVFLRARTTVLGVDVSKIFEDLDEVHKMIGQTINDMFEGEWPEMFDFILTFVKHTLTSKKFWLKVDAVNHDQVLAAKESYETREAQLNNWIKTNLRPNLQSLLNYMSMISTQDSQFLKDSKKELDNLDIALIVEGPLKTLTHVVSKYYLSCYTALYGKPDFLQVQEMVENNSVAKLVKDIFTADWSPHSPPPKRLVEFIMKFQDMVLLLFNASWGTYESPNQI